ncbi:hypothetical protein FHW88_000485 [Mucilaginibacter sp. SG538B]|uniref:PKD domain-containing protein n=1 Tax=Mucilaginibacter sp. SG538B TaxID=2587021 RepID=UPI00159E70EB|nr:PKD domain-containing protein [Mucilaginibacter sp. SG538B]NVM62209.1 hypothetical protein [Mucilaginibacter sp. SG538B]
MNKKHLVSCLFLCLCFCGILRAQTPVDVNLATGSLNVSIPVYTLSKGQVSLPVSLAYSTNGIKPKEVESTAGMSWEVIAGGQISRRLRGIPDDVSYDDQNVYSNGWMKTNYSAFISGFNIANDNNYLTCPDEIADVNYINGYFVDTNEDTEPDIFDVNAPGLSCQLVYDRATAKFKLVSYQDLIITYTTNGGTGAAASLVNSFTIINDKGIKYVFAAPDKITQKTVLGSNGNAQYLVRKYKIFQHGITFYNNWHLTSITDPSGNGIQLNYVTVPDRSGTDPVILHISGSSTPSVQYYIQQKLSAQQLSTINTFDVVTTTTGLSFNRSSLIAPGQTGQTIITSITGIGHNFQFTYTPVIYSATGYSRAFLRSFSDAGCSSPVSYTFNYKAESVSNGNYTTVLPDSGTVKVDYWGYYSPTTNTTLLPKVWINPSNSAYPRYTIYNPSTGGGSYTYASTAGNNRPPMNSLGGEAEVCIGCLGTVGYAQGGSTTITYEQNTYLDVPSNQSVIGGGIRVQQLTDYDGINTANNIVRNYSYVVPGGAVSSGKPVTLPMFAFTAPTVTGNTGQSLWDYVTVLSDYDLSVEDHTIVYSYVKKSQAGSGSSLYQFYMPATYWDSSAAPACAGCSAEWAPTINYAARSSCNTNNWNVKNDLYSYPFVPNPNYDFERGLPLKMTAFNDAGTKVSERTFTYQRVNAIPAVITAFKYDDITFAGLTSKGYNKYNIYYNAGELVSQVTEKVYDSPTLSQARTKTTNYFYASANHKKLTRQQVTNSDGSVLTNNYTYVKDYPSAAAGSNANVNALYYMQQPALNMNLPVESYQQATKGSATVTTSASLKLYSATTVGSNTRYLPSKQLTMVQPDGVPSAASPTAFTPFSVNGTNQTSASDSRYFTAGNFTKYDNYGYLVTGDDNNKNNNTRFTDHMSGQPVASFARAKFGEMAFSDFDTDIPTSPSYGFTIGGSGGFTPTGSHTGASYGLPATTGTLTSPSITKNTTSANYIFSVWINATTAGTLNLTFTGGTTLARQISYSGTWKYYELKVPVTALAATFTLSISSTQNISVDDILLYPEVATAATASFDPVYHYKTSETNTNGVSGYFVNDQWGRMLYKLDQDKNIIERNSYLSHGDVQGIANPSISNNQFYKGHPGTFTLSGPDACSAVGVTVDWNFGDGTGTVTSSGLISPNHTYTTAGQMSVTATLHSPLFGDKVVPAKTVFVDVLNVNLTYYNNTNSGAAISSVKFYDSSGANLLYSFIESQLGSSTVPQGAYRVVVTMTGGPYNTKTQSGYASVQLAGDCWTDCSAYASSNTYTFNADLSNCNVLDFGIYTYIICGI